MQIIIKLLCIPVCFFFPNFMDKVFVYIKLGKAYKLIKNKSIINEVNHRNYLINSMIVNNFNTVKYECEFYLDSTDKNLDTMLDLKDEREILLKELFVLGYDVNCVDYLISNRIKHYKKIHKLTHEDIKQVENILKNMEI